MQKLMITFFLIYSLLVGHALALDPDYKRSKLKFPEDNALVFKNSMDRSLIRSQKSVHKLKQIKFLIINGNLKAAKALLNDAKISQDFSKAIQLRYLAIINFAEGNFTQVLQNLTSKEFGTIDRQPKVCAMKVLSELILGKIADANISWRYCREATSYRSPTNLLWLQTIVNLKNQRSIDPFKKIAIDNEKGEFLRIFLKLALYLHRQKSIMPRFQYFGPDVLEDLEMRELIGLNYFRNGDLVQAYQFLEDLDTPNSEVFKGNIYLFQNKYELAYAQYKLALKKKNNSQNALERIIPVSWKLAQWNDGLNFLKKLEPKQENRVEHMTLISLFLIMDKKNDHAAKVLNRILATTNKGQPLEVNQLLSLNSLIRDKKDRTNTFSNSACQNQDGLNCWLLFQGHYWDSPSKVFKKKENIHSELKDLISFYSSKQEQKGLNGTKYVNQRVIEEMDNAEINLLNTTK